MFTSRVPGQFPRDLHPYVWLKNFNYKYQPRPQFNTPVNPVLREFWDCLYWSRVGTVALAIHWLEPNHWPGVIEDLEASPEQIEHARKVLTRLAALDNEDQNG